MQNSSGYTGSINYTTFLKDIFLAANCRILSGTKLLETADKFGTDIAIRGRSLVHQNYFHLSPENWLLSNLSEIASLFEVFPPAAHKQTWCSPSPSKNRFVIKTWFVIHGKSFPAKKKGATFVLGHIVTNRAFLGLSIKYPSNARFKKNSISD